MIDPAKYKFEDLLYRAIKLIEQHLDYYENQQTHPEFSREGKQLIGEWKSLNANLRYLETKNTNLDLEK